MSAALASRSVGAAIKVSSSLSLSLSLSLSEFIGLRRVESAVTWKEKENGRNRAEKVVHHQADNFFFSRRCRLHLIRRVLALQPRAFLLFPRVLLLAIDS